MNDKTQNGHRFELFAYTLFSAFLASAVVYLCYYKPVAFAFLVTEDSIAEYLTSVSFGLAGVILLILAFKSGAKMRKFIWLLIGVVALIIAAEEISWGQRILSIKTPDSLSVHNIQEEITLHNLVAFQAVNSKLHTIVSYLILLYLFFSVIVLTLMPRFEEKLTAIGFPLIPIRLIPIFLLVAYFLLTWPVFKADEFGELFLGIAALMWAVDLYLTTPERKRSDQFKSVLIMLGMLSLAVILSAGMAYRYPNDPALTLRLNSMASRDYTDGGLHEQAGSLYNYIYENPRHLRPETRLNHARTLLAVDKKLEAADIVSVAIREIELDESKNVTSSRKLRIYSDQLRSIGEIFISLDKQSLADNYFDRAFEVGQKALSAGQASDSTKAHALWSISQTMAARGDMAAAISNAERAIEMSSLPSLSHKIEQQLNNWRM